MSYSIVHRFHDGCDLCQQCEDRAVEILEDNPTDKVTVTIKTALTHSVTVRATEEEVS